MLLEVGLKETDWSFPLEDQRGQENIQLLAHLSEFNDFAACKTKLLVVV